MQTLEAMLSLLLFCAAVPSLLLPPPQQIPTDDSLYRLQLAEDAWRVLYLRGAFRDFGVLKEAAVESELASLGEETGLCFFMEGVRLTNCRGGMSAHSLAATISRTVIYEGKARQVSFSIGK